jgi:surface carbohydrate biosynthesis protein
LICGTFRTHPHSELQSMFKMANRFLYLPIEIAARELDSRLLIALFAVDKGLEVICGQKWLLQKNARQMPPGFWLFKTLTPGDRKQMLRVRRLNSIVGAIDEEMPGLSGGSGQLRWIENQATNVCDVVFCQGNQHFEMMARQFPDMVSRLCVTGNPRWDVLRPDMQSLLQNNAAQYGVPCEPFILINTNFGFINSAKRTIKGHVHALKKDGRLKSSNADDMRYLERIIAFEKSNFNAITSAAIALSESFPDLKVILRPHPGETIETYLDAFKRHPKIQVRREGPVAYWLQGCAVLVHTNCTTATEAFALGKTAIFFKTVESPINEEFLSNKFSIVAKSETEVVENVSAVLSGNLDCSKDVKMNEILDYYFAARDGKLAAARIAALVHEKLPSNNKKASGQTEWQPGILFRRKWRPSQHQRSIFPDFTQDDIENRLKQMAAASGLNVIPNVHKCGDGLFHIYPAAIKLSAKSQRRKFFF